MSMEKYTIRQLRELGRRELSERQEYQVAALETDLLLSKVLDEGRLYMELHPEELVRQPLAERFIRSLGERREGRPIAYLLGHREFMGYDYLVEEGVLIPRSDTEVVVELASEAIRRNDAGLGLELGVGTGVISLSLLASFPRLRMLGVDINEKAVALSQKNALYLDNQHYDEDGVDYKIEERFDVTKSNLFEDLHINPHSLDFIISNPPYINARDMQSLMRDVVEYEPHNALFGGEDGLDFYRAILEQGLDLLKVGGFVAFEMGYDQGDALYELMQQFMLKNIRIAKDLAGHDRAILGTK